MSSMTDSETYNGYANRETWAFNLHWQNDQGLYNETLARAGEAFTMNVAHSDEPLTDHQLGQYVVNYWHDMIRDYRNDFGGELPEGLAMFRDEVGSWWRIDYAEVGAAVRESLDAEGDGA